MEVVQVDLIEERTVSHFRIWVVGIGLEQTWVDTHLHTVDLYSCINYWAEM